MDAKWKRFLGIALFALGALLAALCAAIATWGDLEAALFDAALSPDAPLNTLRCPILMTTAETATVSVVVDNPLDRTVQFPVLAHISQGHVTWMREEKAQLALAPGERQYLAWTVGPNDAAFGRIVLVRVHAMRSGELPYRAGACGIVVAPLSFPSGGLLLGLLTAAGLLGLGGGIALWALAERPLFGQRRAVARMMGALAGVLVVALLSGFLGLWLVGLLLLLFTVLLSGIIIGFVLTSK